MNLFDIDDILSEVTFQASRSSGPGGQNVNKVNSRVELRFDLAGSKAISEDQKELLTRKLASKLTLDGLIIVTSQEDRSQLKNKEIVIEKFSQLITKALTPVKKRIPTQPSKASEERRLQKKKEQSTKKQTRGKIDY